MQGSQRDSADLTQTATQARLMPIRQRFTGTDMRRTQHPSNNSVLGAPDGWDQESIPCNALPITRCEIEGQAAIASFWMPTKEEIARMALGHPVVLYVLGSGMPPVAIEVE